MATLDRSQTKQAIKSAAQQFEGFGSFFGQYQYRKIDLLGFNVTPYIVTYGKVRVTVWLTDDGIPVAIYPTNLKKRGYFEASPNHGTQYAGLDMPYTTDPCAPAGFNEAVKFIAHVFNCPGEPYDAIAVLGQESGQCAICGEHLTDPDSRARGIGPVCIKKPGVAAWHNRRLMQRARDVRS